METKKIIKEMVSRYGSMQLIIAIEEMSELTKEIAKDLRGKGKREHIIEEMADVQLILDELKEYYNISQDDIYKVKRKKVIRTKKLYLNDNPVQENNCEEKSLMALEIIKEKGCDISWLKYCIKENLIVEAYNSGYHEYDKKLTQEEFNLLKEVLE